MKDTRKKILRTLLAQPNSSIKDLAEAVGINGISIRHHLTNLEAENLIASSEERHGVGRPRLIYSLTDKGAEQFPTSYLSLTRRLISVLKESLPEDQLESIFQSMGEEIANKNNFEFSNHNIEERLDFLKQILTKEGFIVDWEKNGEVFHLTSFSCPYYQIGLDHPEVCKIDHTLISSFFIKPITIKKCIFEGDDHCIYEIHSN